MLKWEPIWHSDIAGQVVGWKLDARNCTVTVKTMADADLTWTGRCDALFDYPVVLASASDVSAKREFLKMCLRKARALTSELEGVWTRTEGK